MDETTKQLIDDINAAKKRLYEHIEKTFPPGTKISWINRHYQVGTVIRLNGGWWSEPELLVHNKRTEKDVIVRLHQEPMVFEGGI